MAKLIGTVMLQADLHWPDLCTALGRPELIDDPRFKDSGARFEHRRECFRADPGVVVAGEMAADCGWRSHERQHNGSRSG